MACNYSCLGTGEMKITQVNINDITANDAIWRIRSLEQMALKAKLSGNRSNALLEIAKYALKGNKGVSLSKKCYDVQFENVDIYELNEQGLSERVKDVTRRIDTIIGVHSFLEIARVALTGVPF